MDFDEIKQAVYLLGRLKVPVKILDALLEVFAPAYAELDRLRASRRRNIERAKQHKERAIAQGRCAICGKKSKLRKCKACTLRCNASARRSKERRKEAGLCLRCPESVENGRVLCAGCAAANREYQKKRYEERKAQSCR